MTGGWDQSAAAWITALGEHGDYTRTHILDPVMIARIAGRGFASALDVGCGEGRFCRIMREHGIATVGIDPTCGLLDQARHLDPVGDYLSARAEELPFPDERFDLVISYLSLIDIADAEQAIAEMARVLKCGGTLLIANLTSFSSAAAPGWARDDKGKAIHCHPVDNYLDERAEWFEWNGIRGMIFALTRRHLHVEVDRWGNRRVYFRVGRGPRVRIREVPGTEEFDKRYHELMRQYSAGELKRPARNTPVLGTFRWLCIEHFKCTAFKQLDERTQHVTRLVVEKMLQEPIAPGAEELFAECPLSRFDAKAVRILRDRRADRPEAANNRVRRLRRIFAWALDTGIEGVLTNPARDVPLLKPNRAGGFPTGLWRTSRSSRSATPSGARRDWLWHCCHTRACADLMSCSLASSTSEMVCWYSASSRTATARH